MVLDLLNQQILHRRAAATLGYLPSSRCVLDQTLSGLARPQGPGEYSSNDYPLCQLLAVQRCNYSLLRLLLLLRAGCRRSERHRRLDKQGMEKHFNRLDGDNLDQLRRAAVPHLDLHAVQGERC